MSLLATLVFVFAAVVVAGALRLTLSQYRDAALRNVAALRDCSVAREFRVQVLTVFARPAPGIDVRRVAPRPCPSRRIRFATGLRAAA